MTIESGIKDIEKAKMCVIENSFGIRTLSELDLLNKLEEIYWAGFKAGLEKSGDFIDRETSNDILDGCLP